MLGGDRPLGQVDQVRGSFERWAPERRGGRYPARLAAHDLHELDRRRAPHRRGVERRLLHRYGQVASRAAVARAVIRRRQVVVDRLGRGDGRQRVARGGGSLAQARRGVRRIVAADEHEVARVVPAQDGEGAL